MAHVKLSILSILFSLITVSNVFSQDRNSETKIKVVQNNPLETISNQHNKEGISYLGFGDYQILRIGSSGFSSTSGLLKKAQDDIIQYSKNQDLNYKIKSTEEFKLGVGVMPKVKIIFQLLNKNGNIIITKDEAQKKLLDLKMLLSKEIITQEEFENKSKYYKSIILAEFE